ncbi:hypothetical protein SAMN05421803_107157 [Nocardiopsis flavescens]|uniref:Uncharacterized protein n=1 Tax=Nocardiopsis flavescens TaxID=758803 RepID=A0A1M6KFP2_9ACTN|nr:hypothetical protein [Nocardiopsis flavescens]SHJ57756.1 hypothetical protein SAMN05421803_107157 [Nocardiopsis flavescens]
MGQLDKGAAVIDPNDECGVISRIYTEEGTEFAEVEYDEPQWTGEYTLDWDAADVRPADQ